MTSRVGAGLIIGVLETAQRRYGLDPAELLAVSGLHADEVRDVSALVPTHAFEQVLRLALRRTGDPAFGLRCAEELDLREQGFWGYAMLSSTTVRERLVRNIRYSPLVGPSGITLREEGGFAFVEVTMHGIAVDLAPVLMDSTCASGCLKLMRQLQRPPRDLHVSFTQREQPHHRELRALIPGTVEFGAARNLTRFAACDLDAPIGGDRHLGALAAAQLDAQLAALQASEPPELLERIRQRIAARLHDDASLERIAGDLHVSVRTLQRMLDSEGASFAALTADVRRSRAVAYLTDTDEPVERIAVRLGYGDPSTFRRAFRRWMGCAPGTFREQQRSGTDAE